MVDHICLRSCRVRFVVRIGVDSSQVAMVVALWLRRCCIRSQCRFFGHTVEIACSRWSRTALCADTALDVGRALLEHAHVLRSDTL